MSRRQRTILTVSLSIPQPPGKTHAWTLDELKRILTNSPGLDLPMYELVLKLVSKETTYL